MTSQRWAFIHPFQLRLQRGIEVYLWELSSALAQSGVEVDILTWAGPLQIPSYVSSRVHIKPVPSSRYYQHLAAIPYYVWYLTKNHYDHVFVHFAGYGEGPALSLVKKMINIPFSVVFHFPPSLVPHRYREFERWGFQRDAKHLIGVSHATAREVEQWSGRSCDVIVHGVDTERFKPDAGLRAQSRKALGISAESPVLISAAALEERKGIQWAVDAMPKVLAEQPDARYLILGDGPYRMALEEQVRRLGLQASVSFMGFQKDIVSYLAASDVALLLSYGEASPISLLEFAAVGLPVITSCHEPFPELVQPEWGGIVNEQNIEMLTSKLFDMIQKQDVRMKMGKAGRAYVINHHSWANVAEQYRNLVG